MTPDNTRELIAELREWAPCAMTPAQQKDLLTRAADALAVLSAPQEAGDMTVAEFSSALGFEDETGTAKLRDIVDPILQWESESRDHVECPRLCEMCGETLARSHCTNCGGGGQLPGYNGTVSECGECGGAGFIHEGCVEQSYAELAVLSRAAVPEPEWEREYRRVRPDGVPVFNAVFESMPVLDGYYTAEYRAVSPWLPVGGDD